MSKDRRKRFPTFEKLLNYAVDDNEIMKIPLVSKTELEQDTFDDSSFAGSFTKESSSHFKSHPPVVDRFGLFLCFDLKRPAVVLTRSRSRN